MAPRPSADLAASTYATKGQRTRRRLLQQAVERFGEQGYRATSVSEIARAVGISQASAYAYFANKESLFSAAVDQDATALVLRAHNAVTETPVHDKFRALMEEMLAGLDHHRLTRRVLAGEEPEVLPRLVDLPAFRIATGLLVDDLRAGQAKGTVRHDVDIESLGLGVEAIVLSLLVATVQSGGAYRPRYEAGVYAAFDAMLRPPETPA